MYVGTSWEGVVWKVDDERRTALGRMLEARMLLQLAAAAAPVLAILMMVIFVAPAEAHPGAGQNNRCYGEAYKPYNYRGVAANGRARCPFGGQSHKLTVQIYKHRNNWPDLWIASNHRWSTSKSWTVNARGDAAGCGAYRSYAKVYGHGVWDGSPNYYRC